MAEHTSGRINESGAYSNEYEVQNAYKYTRKSYKKNNRGRPERHENDGFSPRDDDNVGSNLSPRSDRITKDLPSCSCDIDHDGEIASILHLKCPIISLAKQQFQELLDDPDKILCNTRSCRSIYDFLWLCQQVFLRQKCVCTLLFLIVLAFFLGLLLGSASCGSCHGNFNSPLMTCLDNFFVPETHRRLAEFRGLV